MFQWTSWQGVMNIGQWSEKNTGGTFPSSTDNKKETKHSPYGVNNYLTTKNKTILYRRCALWRHGDTKTSRFCPALCARIVFCINLGVIAFELCDLWRYSLTTFMQNTMRTHSTGQVSTESGVDVNKGHMVYKCHEKLGSLGTSQSGSIIIRRIKYQNIRIQLIYPFKESTTWYENMTQILCS